MSLATTRRKLEKLQRDIEGLAPRGSFGILTGRTTAGVTRRPLTINPTTTTTNKSTSGGARWV